MCGIAGIHRLGNERPERLGQLMDALLWGILPRGTDATGVLAMLDNGKVQLERRTVPAAQFIRTRQLVSDKSRTVLLHTRYATVGRADDPRNAHPVINGHCAAIHNGTIYNHRDLFDAFQLKRHAQVDSEIIPALVSYAGWAQAGDALSLLDGGAATAIVNDEHPRDLILARTQGFPLHWMKLRGLLVWASTEHAIRRAWQQTYGGDPWKARGVQHGRLGDWMMMRHEDGKLHTAEIPWRGLQPPKRRRARAQEPISRPASGRPMSQVPPGKRARKAAAKAAKATKPVKPLGNRRPRAGTQLQLPKAASTGGIVVPEIVVPAVERHPWDDPRLNPEPWMEETVRDLERQYGLSYEDAYEAVYGVAPMSDEDWLASFGI